MHRLISITDIDLAPDLSQAQVSITAERGINKLVSKLNHKAGHLQRLIQPQLTQKRTPKLFFSVDDEAVRMKRIDELLAE